MANIEMSGGLPAGACDCHVHVFAGPDAPAYPYAPGRLYTPGEATAGDYLALRSRLGLERVVLVQPSVYGTDNRLHLETLATMPRARGVAVIAGDEPDGELARLHDAGFRGIRINLVQAITSEPVANTLVRLGARLTELGWHLQVNARIDRLVAEEAALAACPVPVMFDHYAGLSPWAGPDQPGAAAVMRLMRAGNAWIKLSAPYMHKGDTGPQGMDNARRLVAALIEAGANRLVWASNWPHPGFVPPTTAQDAPVAPFREVDDEAMLAMFSGWVGEEAALRAILTDNAAAFYGF